MDGVLELGMASELSPPGECQGSGPDGAVFTRYTHARATLFEA